MLIISLQIQDVFRRGLTKFVQGISVLVFHFIHGKTILMPLVPIQTMVLLTKYALVILLCIGSSSIKI